MMKSLITFKNIKLYLVLFALLCAIFGAYFFGRNSPEVELDVTQISRNAVKEYAQIFKLDESKFLFVSTELMENRWLVTYDSPYPDSVKLFIIIKRDGTYEVSMRSLKKHDLLS